MTYRYLDDINLFIKDIEVSQNNTYLRGRFSSRTIDHILKVFNNNFDLKSKRLYTKKGNYVIVEEKIPYYTQLLKDIIKYDKITIRYTSTTRNFLWDNFIGNMEPGSYINNTAIWNVNKCKFERNFTNEDIVETKPLEMSFFLVAIYVSQRDIQTSISNQINLKYTGVPEFVLTKNVLEFIYNNRRNFK